MNVEELEAAFEAEARARKAALLEKQFSAAALQSPVVQTAILATIGADYGQALGGWITDQYTLLRAAEEELRPAEELAALPPSKEEESSGSANVE